MNGTTEITYLRCEAHPRNVPFAFGRQDGCAFVRNHYHVAGECRGWDGLTGGEHPRDNGLRCECGRDLVRFTVRATETDTDCGDRCQSATGPACECKCKGEGHGLGPLVTVEPMPAYIMRQMHERECPKNPAKAAVR